MAYGLLSPNLMGRPQSMSLQSALQPQTGGLLRRLLGGGLVGTGQFVTGDTRDGPRRGEIAEPRSGIGQRLRDLLDPRIALPAAGEMIAGRTPAAGFGAGLASMGAGLGDLRKEREGAANKQRTMEYLTKAHPDLAQMVDMGMPMSSAWGEALKRDGGGNKQGLINTSDGIYDPNTGEWINNPNVAAGGAFTGNSVEAQAYRKLIADGMSESDAARWAVTKFITDPTDGSIRAVSPQDILGGGVAPGGGAIPSATSDPLISPTGGAPGVGIQVTGPKAIRETDTSRNRKTQVDGAVKSVDSALTRWEALVTKSGMSAIPGQEQDDLITTRQGIMLELKELFNLGVLNGPDLALMENMIFDPVVDPSKGKWDMVKKGASALGVGGDVTARAKNNVATLRKLIKEKRDAAFAASDGTIGGVPPPGGAVDYNSMYGLTPP